MSEFYLSNEEVTESDGSEAWVIMEKFRGNLEHIYQMGFKDKAEAEETLKRIKDKK